MSSKDTVVTLNDVPPQSYPNRPEAVLIRSSTKDMVNICSEYLIERVSVKFQMMDRAYVIRKQFPLSLNYGITIHKSLGKYKMLLDIGNLYLMQDKFIALSRVTFREDFLINYDPSSIKASEVQLLNIID
ncbi:uncharacterized protein LOC105426530 [Pogonomyrmex barbatus]|uniref:Uncharacterized protein LOC105426530 n=1 Tax=Pogonomyrmex barbatus TaxID=144034 RepID=A0A6I9W2Z7_9HYME|nr:uncharacterized protein LOC105426530 [Pogonomyrmex barbatus]